MYWACCPYLLPARRGTACPGSAVEAFARVWAGGHDQERRAAGLLQAGERRRAALDPHPASKDDEVLPGLAQKVAELSQMAGPGW